MSILAIGNAIYDTVMFTDTLPLGSKAFCSDVQEFSGGQGANAAVTMAGLGQPVEFIGRFGGDSAGNEMMRHMSSEGISLQHSVYPSASKSTRGWIMVEQNCARRTILMSRDPALYAYPLTVPDRLAREHDIFYSDGHEVGATIAIAEKFRHLSKPVVIDLEHTDGACVDMLRFTTHLIAPEEVIMELGNAPDLSVSIRQIADAYGLNVVATCGERGSFSLFRDSTEILEVPAVPIQAIDTTGAGDAFHGAFVAALNAGRTEPECSAFATRVAALKCVQRGPQLSGALLDDFRSELRAQSHLKKGSK
jgi:sulfofructose kinase